MKYMDPSNNNLVSIKFFYNLMTAKILYVWEKINAKWETRVSQEKINVPWKVLTKGSLLLQGCSSRLSPS